MPVALSETSLLNFYRASELHGGLILGQLVRRTNNPALILSLTRHSADDVMHSRLWTETILAIGGRPTPVRASYQTLCAEVTGTPRSLLEMLALTQIFEWRLYRHFTLHLQVPALHPAVAATLRRVLDEERSHISWVKRWLDGQVTKGRRTVREALRHYTLADQRIYGSLCREHGVRWAT
jgi:hypothetical protein